MIKMRRYKYHLPDSLPKAADARKTVLVLDRRYANYQVLAIIDLPRKPGLSTQQWLEERYSLFVAQRLYEELFRTLMIWLEIKRKRKYLLQLLFFCHFAESVLEEDKAVVGMGGYPKWSGSSLRETSRLLELSEWKRKWNKVWSMYQSFEWHDRQFVYRKAYQLIRVTTHIGLITPQVGAEECVHFYSRWQDKGTWIQRTA